MNSVIEFLCASSEHRVPQDVESPVLIHDGCWAYCPAGVAEGHDWRATGGKTLAAVRDYVGRPLAHRRSDTPPTVGAGR